MNSFTVIGHVWKVLYANFGDTVWFTTQNGTMEVHFPPSMAKNALISFIDKNGKFTKDMLSELIHVNGIIRGEYDKPYFEGLTIRAI